MWTEFQRSGIFDEVVQWSTLSTFLETLTFVSACWWFCFPELPRPPVPADEFESIQHLAHLDMILEVLTLVRIALQIPMTAVSHTRQAAANRYELHRCRMTAYLLVCFLQRLVSQDNGYLPPFFEVLHFYKTLLLRDIMYSTFADVLAFLTYMASYKILDIINSHVSTLGSRHGTARTTLEPQIRMSCAGNIPDAANICNSCVASVLSLNLENNKAESAGKPQREGLSSLGTTRQY